DVGRSDNVLDVVGDRWRLRLALCNPGRRRCHNDSLTLCKSVSKRLPDENCSNRVILTEPGKVNAEFSVGQFRRRRRLHSCSLVPETEKESYGYMVCADRNLAVAIDDLRPTDCESLTRNNYSCEDNEDRKPPFHDHYLTYLHSDYLYFYFTSFRV